ncbi:MAG: PIG-L deacetylase family protein [Chloroflexota bacterium]
MSDPHHHHDPEQEMSHPAAAVDAEAFEAAAEAAMHTGKAGPKRVAVIFAHPDDAEFICAGTVARWVAEGHHVTYVLITSGNKGSDDPEMTPERLAAIRTVEQRDAAAILGVAECVFMDKPDGMLVPDLDLRRDMVRVIRSLKPDVVICQDPSVRYVAQSYLNHSDHRVAGDVTLDAIFPAARNRMYFPELLDEGLEPHKVSEVYLAGALQPDVAIDITPYMDLKLAALRAHVSQLGDWDPTGELQRWAREDASRFPGSGEFAESFKYFKLD